MKFIYVFDEIGRDYLLKRKFHLLKEDKDKSIWIFENIEEDIRKLNFSASNIKYVVSDMMTF